MSRFDHSAVSDINRYLLPPPAARALARGDRAAAIRLLRQARALSLQQASALVHSHARVEPVWLLREDGSRWKVPAAVHVALDHNDSAAAAALLQQAEGIDRKDALDTVAWLCLHRVAVGAGSATAGDAGQSAEEYAIDRRGVWALAAAGVAIGVAVGAWLALRQARAR